MLQAKARDGGFDPFIVCLGRFFSYTGAVALTDAVLEAGVLDIVQAAEFLAKLELPAKPFQHGARFFRRSANHQGLVLRIDACRLQPKVAGLRCFADDAETEKGPSLGTIETRLQLFDLIGFQQERDQFVARFGEGHIVDGVTQFKGFPVLLVHEMGEDSLPNVVTLPDVQDRPVFVVEVIDAG